MELKTYDDWKAAGFQVRRGEKAYLRSETERKPALFNQGQVDPIEYDDEEERNKDAHYGFDGW